MKVVAAKSSGFCFGVQRAVSMCEEAAELYDSCVTLGPIIHNEHVVRALGEKGVGVAHDISDISPDDVVIIRSHGASKDEYERLETLGARIIDATCPDVRRIHEIVRKGITEGRTPLIIGERDHPEVRAISSWCADYEIFETAPELQNWLDTGANSQKPVTLVFQTTNTAAICKACSDIVKKECTNHEIFDTICGATFKRQQEAAELAQNSDVMIVVGGINSANSLRLADICREYCSRVIFTESAEGLEHADIHASDTVGVISGASTPAWIIKEVTRKMSDEIKLDETCLEQENEEAADVSDTDIPVSVQDADDVPADAADETEAPDEREETEDSPANAADEQSAVDAPADEIAADAADEQEPPAEDSAADAQADEPSDNDAEPETPPEEKGPGDAGALPEEETEPSAKAVDEDLPEDAGDTQDTEDSEDGMSASTESFEEMLEKSIKTLHTGQKVSGVVTSITATEVSVDLGAKQSGYVPIAEFTDDANTDIDDIIQVGDTIETFVMRVNDVEGMVMLSKKRLDAIKNWDVIEAAKDNRAIIEGLVTEENKGGIVVNVKGVRVFVPASQTGLPKSSPMTELIRKTVKLRITEVNQSRRRVVGSIRAVQADERREKSERLWNEIEVGKQYDGVVKSMTSYGVFVDIGGVDGMIHISELSWTRIKQPSEVMSVGDDASVYVLSFDKDTRKISLGYKKQEDNPWTKFATNNKVGDVVNVKIVKLMPFGAFAEINPGVDGLIHISQITDHRIGLPSEILSDGQRVDVKITEIDNDRKKVSLSIRALIDSSSQPLTDAEAAEAAAADKTPVIVYDTDAPPPPEPEEDDSAEPAEVPEDSAGDPEDGAADADGHAAEDEEAPEQPEPGQDAAEEAAEEVTEEVNEETSGVVAEDDEKEQ